MLSMTKIDLELILNIDMYLFFGKNIKGGGSYISKRYSYLKSYDPKQESTHIYVDANNFYGYATSKFIPTGEFQCIDPKEFDSNKCTSNSSKGCVLEVDIEYPKELR